MFFPLYKLYEAATRKGQAEKKAVKQSEVRAGQTFKEKGKNKGLQTETFP